MVDVAELSFNLLRTWAALGIWREGWANSQNVLVQRALIAAMKDS